MIDGSQYELSEEITLDKNLKHNISIIVENKAQRNFIENYAALFLNKASSE